jgi:hypothetical protein
MNAQSHVVHQDIVRGVRWGTVLVLVVLLGVAAYRMLISTPVAARQPGSLATVPESSPEIHIQPQSASEVALNPSPARVPVRQPSAARAARPSGESVPPPPPLSSARSAFVAAPAARSQPSTALVVDGALPEAEGIAVDADFSLPAASSELAPPPEAKPGRTSKIVRGVGRIFGVGKKNPEEK